MSLVVATYFWNPDKGSKFAHQYKVEDVKRLQRQVKTHLPVQHEFVVITDKPHWFEGEKDIRALTIDYLKHVPGTCFVRLMTFMPEGREFIGEKVLQIDLDTLIVGDLTPIVERDEDLVLWRNPGRVPWHLDNRRCYYNTSVVLHRCGTMPDVWHNFDPKRPSAKDDQWYLSDYFGPGCPYFDASHGVYRLARADTPGSGVDGALPDNARIVTFPGSEGKWTKPEIRQANPWIEAHLAVA